MKYRKKLLFILIVFIALLCVVSAKLKIGSINISDILEIKGSNNTNAKLAMDNDKSTRWESTHGFDPGWIEITLKKSKVISSIKIFWETASAKVYKIQISKNGINWNDVAVINDGKKGEERLIEFTSVKTKYIRIYGEARTTEWGYSIWELVINPQTGKKTNYPYNNPELPIEKRVKDLLKRMNLEEKVEILTGATFMDTRANNRLNIPVIKCADGPHGVTARGDSTCFPTGVSIGATWDVELINRLGVALGEETRALGRNVILGPCINIHRTPLGGRNFESYGEDPYLTARLAVAYVNGVQSQKIGTSPKHYACNNQEWERFTISTELDERTLREIYLPAFKASITEADAWTVMASYNKINGDYGCANEYLLTDILKNEWGFRGLVVSDWWAIKSTVKSANAGCDLEMPGPGKYFNANKLLTAINKKQISEKVINDKVRRILRVMFLMELFDDAEKKYKGAVNTKEHKLLAQEIAQNAIVLLKNDKKLLPLQREKIKSIAVIGPNANFARLGGGGSSTVSPSYSISPLEGLKNKCENEEIEVRFAQGCMIACDLKKIKQSLLKPSSSTKKENGLQAEYFNNMNFSGKPVLKRIDKEVFFDWEGSSPAGNVNNDKFSVRWTGILTPELSGEYEIGLMSDDGSRLFINDKLIVDNWGDHAIATKKNPVILEAGVEYNICIEYYDNSYGAVIKLGWIPPDDPFKKAKEIAAESDVAIVFAGLYHGIEGEGVDKKDMYLPKPQDDLINEIVDVNENTIVVLINGTPLDMNKWIDKVHTLVEAWYPGQEGGYAIADILFGDVNPSGKMPVTFPKKYEDSASYSNYPGKNGKVHFKEGIFVGYRHFDKNQIEPLFPFGYGLSYTEFKYSNLKITPDKVTDNKTIEVSLDVENIGDVQGKEVVQLYIHDKKSSLERPINELKGFKKINLKPGEKKTVQFTLDESSLSFFHPDKKKWVCEQGIFEVRIGSSSRDIRLNGSFMVE